MYIENYLFQSYLQPRGIFAVYSIDQLPKKKSCIQEKLNFSISLDNRTNTKKKNIVRKNIKKKHTTKLHIFTFHMSPGLCHLSPVTHHFSPTPTPTATATHPPPAISPTMHSWLVCQNNYS